MLNGKLIQLLQTLSKKELKDFRHYVASDYHNPNRHLEKFIGLLLKFEDDFTNPKLDKDVFFKCLRTRLNSSFANEEPDSCKSKFFIMIHQV